MCCYLLYTDFGHLEITCLKKPLENCYLSVKRVPISNCVLVSGFAKDKMTSKSTLENYFENERKSGGLDVTNVKINHDDNTCLVYFKDHSGNRNVSSLSFCCVNYCSIEDHNHCKISLK